MPQVSLYLDEGVLRESSARASADGLSLSRYVNGALRSAADDTWPRGFADTFGAVSDESFVRPEQPDPSRDAPRDDL